MKRIRSVVAFAFAMGLALTGRAALVELQDGPGGAKLTGPHTEKTLGGIGGIFDKINYEAGQNDPVGEQVQEDYFTNGGSGGAIATFIISVAGNREENEIGIFNMDGELLPIFEGTSTGPTQAQISFLANGDVVIGGFGDGVQVGTTEGFGHKFGFYVSGPGGTFYTDDTKNPGGDPQVLVYQGNGEKIQIPKFKSGVFATNEFIFAFEDLEYAKSDKDFNDFVFLVESIHAIPEPATLLLVGSGLVALGVVSRRRRKV